MNEVRFLAEDVEDIAGPEKMAALRAYIAKRQRNDDWDHDLRQEIVSLARLTSSWAVAAALGHGTTRNMIAGLRSRFEDRTEDRTEDRNEDRNKSKFIRLRKPKRPELWTDAQSLDVMRIFDDGHPRAAARAADLTGKRAAACKAHYEEIVAELEASESCR